MDPVAPVSSAKAIGWREFVALPDWGIPRIKAKADTGARTSALDVVDLDIREDGQVTFHVVVRESPRLKLVEVVAPVIRMASVKPRPGEVEVRPVVRTRMVLGGMERVIEVSLLRREGMLCRMLLGRKALADTFLVDPGSKYLLSGRAADDQAGRT
jgi:hypothetical protein